MSVGEDAAGTAGEDPGAAPGLDETARLRAELAACRQFLAQVMDAEDAARRRIAQLIHDDTLQILLAANQELIEAAPGRAGVTRAHEVIAESITRLREAVLTLHPVTLEQGGLEQALQALATHAERNGECEITLGVEPDAVGVNDELVLSLVRELLANAMKHARASSVAVSVGRDGEAVRVEVSDDGQGIEPGRRERALAEGHIGLATVTQRAHASGGDFELTSEPGRGTRAVALVRAS